jgi:hypothetical protein
MTDKLLNDYCNLIDAHLMIRHTNEWYADKYYEYSPDYNEFRDMFSSGQLISKFWMLERLQYITADFSATLVVGGWYGNLSYFLHQVFRRYKSFANASVANLDIDPRCATYFNSVYGDLQGLYALTGDMYEYDYEKSRYDLIVNTSMEHIAHQRAWLDLLPKRQLVALQSNNYFDCEGHINCSDSLEHFKEQTELSSILYEGKLEFPMYTRYMIIGLT